MRRLFAISVLVVFAGIAPALSAQTAAPAPPPAPRHTGVKDMLKGLGGDVKQLPSMENLWWAGGGGALALAIHPFDDDITRYMSGHPKVDAFFKPAHMLGLIGPAIGSVTVYAWGRWKDQPRASHVGVDLIQAQFISQGLIQTLKYTVRRERPDQSSRNSFPSGHAASAFAFATALDRHLGWRYAVPAYAFATYVSTSMITTKRHWASDVVFGATLGIISGRTVTSNESRPFPLSIRYVPGGAEITFSR